METFSLYTYDSGSLKIFGRRTTRAKHPSISAAKQEYEDYIKLLKRVNNGKDVFKDKQVLVVKYTDVYQSKIIGIIKNGLCIWFD